MPRGFLAKSPRWNAFEGFTALWRRPADARWVRTGAKVRFSNMRCSKLRLLHPESRSWAASGHCFPRSQNSTVNIAGARVAIRNIRCTRFEVLHPHAVKTRAFAPQRDRDCDFCTLAWPGLRGSSPWNVPGKAKRPGRGRWVFMVVREGLEPPARGFSVPCSTN